jgi:c-di-GMP-binding flagellar brake protein YcgR
MYNDVIIGERLRLDVGGLACTAEVRDILPDGRLVISPPQRSGAAVELTPGETVGLTYNSGGGQSSFSARVAERIPFDDVICYGIEYTSLVTKSQRRGFTRIELSIPVGICVLGADTGGGEPISLEALIGSLAQAGASPDSRAPRYQTTTVDLSGGGIAFASKIPYARNILVQCEMTIGEKPFRAEGLVTHVDEDAARDPRYKVCVQFAEMDARQQRRLIRYLMEEAGSLRTR